MFINACSSKIILMIEVKLSPIVDKDNFLNVCQIKNTLSQDHSIFFVILQAIRSNCVLFEI